MEEPPQKRFKADGGPLPPLPAGWTEHKAPTGHTYYYNKATKKSTYTRPAAEYAAPPVPAAQIPTPPFIHSSPAFHAGPQLVSTGTWPNQTYAPQHPPQTYYNGTSQSGPAPKAEEGTHSSNSEPYRPRRQPEDRPKRKETIPNCGSWVLVYTRLGRRFVHNTDTRESFWKFPADVMKAVIALDQLRLEEKHGKPPRGSGGKEQNGAEPTAEPEPRPEDIGIDQETISRHKADLNKSFQREQEEDAALLKGDEEERIWVPPAQTPADKGYDSSEYEEIEVTDDSDLDSNAVLEDNEDDHDPAAPLEFNEDDIAYQLAAMGETYNLDAEEYGTPPSSPSAASSSAHSAAPSLTPLEREQVFHELLSDHVISPFVPWDLLLLAPYTLLDDARFTILPSSRARAAAHASWAKAAIAAQREQQQQQAAAAAVEEAGPRERFLAFVAANVGGGKKPLYWSEFRRKHKREAALRPGSARWAERDMEKVYREFVARSKGTAGEREGALKEVLRERKRGIQKGEEGVKGEVAYWVVEEGKREAILAEAGGE